MQSSSRAPVLSATFRRVSCWIIGGLPGLLHDLGETPVLRLRDPARLDDANRVADAGGVLLVVRVELARAPDDLLVLRVQLRHVDLDDDRLLALVGDDDAAALLAVRRRGLGLRRARDRLALRRLLPRRLRVLVALGARQALALRLRAGDGRWRCGSLGLGSGRLRLGCGRLLDGCVLGWCVLGWRVLG